ncbi:MAG: Gfo/Idh/MocA family oxidoreductase [Rhodobacteraceae bacterium]|nr:Gfo/Idh/MocA family oxidoreductase [Paracoccaceae bacterium]
MKIAVIGAGVIGRIHAQNVAAHPEATLAVICDRDPDVASALADRFGTPAVQSVGETLDCNPDGAIIASTTASHGDVAAACIDAGVPFLCEKPLASDLETARRIVESARRARLVAATAFNRRFDAGYAGIKAAVLAGEIGRVEAVLVTSRTASPPSVGFTRTSGGLFGDKGSHFYDLARWLTGEHPVELFAMGSALVNPAFADIGEVDTAMITMRMPGGTLCQFDFSWRAAYGQDERIEVNGSLGMLQTIQGPVGHVLASRADGQSRNGLFPTWQDRFAPTYADELHAFLDAIQTGCAAGLPSLEDGLAAQEIADAARESARSGMPVRLPADRSRVDR